MTKYLLSHSDQFYFYYSFCLREEKVLNRLVISNNMSQFSVGSSRCKHSIYFLKISSGERTVSGLGMSADDDEDFGSNRLLAKLFPAPKPNPLTMESTNIEGLDEGSGGLGSGGLGLGTDVPGTDVPGSSLVVEVFKLRGILYIYLLFYFLNSFYSSYKRSMPATSKPEYRTIGWVASLPISRFRERSDHLIVPGAKRPSNSAGSEATI